MSDPAQRIVLGTAQFGMDYGIANSAGRLSEALVAETLQVARTGGVDWIDTAALYGQSEECLGRAGVADMKVMTKLAAVPADCRDISGWIEGQVAGSMERLRVPRLQGLSLHRPAQLLGPMGVAILDGLRAMQAAGLVGWLGISVYEPGELGPLFDRHRFDMAQVPVNVLDQRLAGSGWAQRLEALGCEVHARSIFLQGLLLLPSARRPAWCRKWQPVFDQWDGLLQASELSPLQACVAHVLSVPGVSRVVVGVDGPRQLEEILLVARGHAPAFPGLVGSEDIDLLNPSRWPAS